MKPSTQDRSEGKLHEVKGKIKEDAAACAWAARLWSSASRLCGLWGMVPS
jgi:hypothetical protein